MKFQYALVLAAALGAANAMKSLEEYEAEYDYTDESCERYKWMSWGACDEHRQVCRHRVRHGHDPHKAETWTHGKPHHDSIAGHERRSVGSGIPNTAWYWKETRCGVQRCHNTGDTCAYDFFDQEILCAYGQE